MLRIIREDHPAWRGMNPRAWQTQTDYFDWKFHPAFEVVRAQRAELLEVPEPLPITAWQRTATVSAPPGVVYEYSVPAGHRTRPSASRPNRRLTLPSIDA
jgi:hypothetical protein